jgi:3-dehydrosphinganine reductase
MFLYIGLAIVFLFLVVLFVGAAKVPKFNPENKNVIITGGSDGLGLELASQLAQKGANVIIIARDRKRLDGAVEQIKTGLKKSVRIAMLLFVHTTNKAF